MNVLNTSAGQGHLLRGRQGRGLTSDPSWVKVTQLCGINSAVECQLPKLKVAGSNPVSRSRFKVVTGRFWSLVGG